MYNFGLLFLYSLIMVWRDYWTPRVFMVQEMLYVG